MNVTVRVTARLALPLLLLAASAAGACRARDRERAETSTVALTPPVKPAGVVAELVIANPSQLWAELVPMLGSLANVAPKHPELVLGGLFGLPALASTMLVADSPVVGAYLSEASASGLVVAARVKSGRELVASLTTGNAPSHDARVEGELSRLVPRGATSDARGLAVLDDHVLVGESSAFGALGPYLVRAAARRPPPAEPLSVFSSGDALERTLVPLLRRRWQEQRAFLDQASKASQAAKGRPADFAEPAAVLKGADLVAESLFGMLSSAQALSMSFAAEATRAIVDVQLVPRASGPVRDMLAGLSDSSLRALAELPTSTRFGLTFSQGEDWPEAAFADALRSFFGERLSERDLRAASAALVALELGRGRAQTVGFTSAGELVWMGEALDAGKLETGLRGVFEVLRRPPFASLIADNVGKLAVRSAPRPDIVPGKLSALKLELSPSESQRKDGMTRRTVEVAWLIRDRAFILVAAPDADPLLLKLAMGTPDAARDGSVLALLGPRESAAIAGQLGVGSLPDARLAFCLFGEKDALRFRLAATPAGFQSLTRQVAF